MPSLVHHDVNLWIAVDLDFQGLVAPVIRDADGKRLRLIAARCTTSPSGPARRS